MEIEVVPVVTKYRLLVDEAELQAMAEGLRHGIPHVEDLALSVKCELIHEQIGAFV